MPDTNIFDDLLTSTKKLGTPTPPPATAQERVAELPRGNDPNLRGIMEQFILGKMTEAAPTPGADFENFFRSRYSPAQEFVSNFIRGAVATGKGTEASNVREESLKEWQIFQKEQQASKQAQLQTLGVLTSLMQNRERLAEDHAQAKTAAEHKALEFGWTVKMDIAEAEKDAIRLQKEIATAAGASEATKQQVEESKARVKENLLANPTTPEGIAYRIHQTSHDGKDPETPEEFAQLTRNIRDLTDASTQKTQGDGTAAVTPEGLGSVRDMFVQTGDMAILNHKSVGTAGKMAILSELGAGNTIVGSSSPTFRKAVNPSMIAASAFADYNELLIAAKSKNATTKDSVAWQKASGFLNRIEGVIGTDAFAAVLSKIRGPIATLQAKAFGEQRVTDADVNRFIQMAGQQTDTFKEIEQIVRFQKRRAYSVILTELQGLPQIGGAPPIVGEAVPLEDVDIYLAKENEVRKLHGLGELNIADFMRLRLEGGRGFK